MEKITFGAFKGLRLETFTKNYRGQVRGDEVIDYAVTAESKHPLIVHSADEVICFFYVPGRLIGAAKLGKEATLAELLKQKLKQTIVQYNLDPKKIVAYFGPCLTFSHTLVERPLIEKLMATGYRAAAKRTDGVDFFDMNVMNLVMLRSLGIDPTNIYIDDHDTFENPSLLFSKLRGDKSENVSVIERLD